MKTSLLVIFVTIYLQYSVTAQETVCENGYKWSGTECVRSGEFLTITPVASCNTCGNNKCPAGYELRNNACYPINPNSATCPDGTTPLNGRCTVSITCPVNYEYKNGDCVKTVFGDLVCESGYHFENGKCISSDWQRPNCPSGSTFNEKLLKCTQIVDKQCPPGSVLSFGKCTATEYSEINCQSGYVLEGSVCVKKIQAECSGTWENGNCVIHKITSTVLNCPYGYELINGECQKRGQARTECPSNSYLDGSQCRFQASVTCPSEYSLREGRCVKLEETYTDVTCPFGYEIQGLSCIKYVSPTIVCREGVLEGEFCVIRQRPIETCDYPYTYDSITHTCSQIVIVPIQCFGGATLFNGYCVTSVPVVCSFGFNLVGNVCQRTTTTPPICVSPAIESDYSCVIIDVRPPQCPIEHTLENGNCVRVSIVPPRCTSGFTLIKEQCIRYEVVPPVCQYPYVYDTVEKVCIFVPVPPPGPIPTNKPPCNGNNCGCSKVGSGCTNTNTNTININNVVNNNNTVSVPTNIHSTNINNISVPKAVERVEKEEKKEVVVAPEEKCCTIITPRQCTQESGTWNCQHKKYSRCGSFCRQSQMFLRPVQTVYRDNMLVMPPPPRRLPYRHYGALGKLCWYINFWTNLLTFF